MSFGDTGLSGILGGSSAGSDLGFPTGGTGGGLGDILGFGGGMGGFGGGGDIFGSSIDPFGGMFGGYSDPTGSLGAEAATSGNISGGPFGDMSQQWPDQNQQQQGVSQGDALMGGAPTQPAGVPPPPPPPTPAQTYAAFTPGGGQAELGLTPQQRIDQAFQAQGQPALTSAMTRNLPSWTGNIPQVSGTYPATTPTPPEGFGAGAGAGFPTQTADPAVPLQAIQGPSGGYDVPSAPGDLAPQQRIDQGFGALPPQPQTSALGRPADSAIPATAAPTSGAVPFGDPLMQTLPATPTSATPADIQNLPATPTSATSADIQNLRQQDTSTDQTLGQQGGQADQGGGTRGYNPAQNIQSDLQRFAQTGNFGDLMRVVQDFMRMVQSLRGFPQGQFWNPVTRQYEAAGGPMGPDSTAAPGGDAAAGGQFPGEPWLEQGQPAPRGTNPFNYPMATPEQIAAIRDRQRNRGRGRGRSGGDGSEADPGAPKGTDQQPKQVKTVPATAQVQGGQDFATPGQDAGTVNVDPSGKATQADRPPTGSIANDPTGARTIGAGPEQIPAGAQMGQTTGAAASTGDGSGGAAAPSMRGGRFPTGRGAVQPIVANTLRQAGMSNNAISGILFNIGQESSFNPTLRHADQPHFGGEAHFAHGLYQEGGDEWNNYARWLRGRDWRDPQNQTQFLAQNLRSRYPRLWNAMNNARTPEQAASLFASGYLRPANRYLMQRLNTIHRGGVRPFSLAEQNGGSRVAQRFADLPVDGGTTSANQVRGDRFADLPESSNVENRQNEPPEGLYKHPWDRPLDQFNRPEYEYLDQATDFRRRGRLGQLEGQLGQQLGGNMDQWLADMLSDPYLHSGDPFVRYGRYGSGKRVEPDTPDTPYFPSPPGS